MKAVFIHRNGPQFASYRYRAEIPAQAIGGTVNGGEANVLIFSKPTPDDLALAKESKAEGIKIVFDVGDDHFNHPTWGPIYREMVELADAMVTPTDNMKDRIRKYFGIINPALVTVIPDPYEEAYATPHANGAERLLWYGHQINLKELSPWMEFLKGLNLTVVTGENHHWKADYLRWSPEVQTEQLHRAHVVLIPTRKGVEYKSANRLVNALRAGCFPVCGDQIPSYHEFRKVAWVGNFSTGLKWAQAEANHLNALVAEGQEYIKKFSPESVGAQWSELIEGVCR